jgi:predicted phosphodiesterase
MMKRMSRAPRRLWMLVLAAAGGGALASLLLMQLIPAVTGTVGPTKISAHAAPGFGHTRLLIPPLGAVEAHTNPGPLSMTLSLAEIDIPRLSDSFEADPTGSTLTAELERDLRGLAVSLVLRLLIGGMLIGALILEIFTRRRLRYVLAGALGGAAAMGVAVAVTATTFSVDAFAEPRFTGALTRAPVVIDALQSNELSFNEVESRFSTAADRLTELLTLIDHPVSDPRADSVAILHISDVHSNPIGLEIAKQLARQFDVDAVLDTGDLTNFGVGLETRVTSLVRGFDVPYLYVPGNHDSTAVRKAMTRTAGVTVLDGSLAEVEGITILGFKDPTYTNWNSLPPEEAAAIRVEFGVTVGERVAQSQPDILAVHDRRIASGSFGLVPLILSGHYHKQIVEEDRGTRMLAVGSTGAAGLKSFTLEADMNYEAEILYFRDGLAVAFDYVRFTGLGNNFVIERKTLEDLGPLEPPEPTESSSPSPSDS